MDGAAILLSRFGLVAGGDEHLVLVGMLKVARGVSRNEGERPRV